MNMKMCDARQRRDLARFESARERERNERANARETRIPSIYIYSFEAIFSAHRFCEGPPFKKAKHFSTSDGNSKKSVSSLRIYIYIYMSSSIIGPREKKS